MSSSRRSIDEKDPSWSLALAADSRSAEDTIAAFRPHRRVNSSRRGNDIVVDKPPDGIWAQEPGQRGCGASSSHLLESSLCSHYSMPDSSDQGANGPRSSDAQSTVRQ